MEVIQTSKGKPSLIHEGYQYRLKREGENTKHWRCLKDRSTRCKGSLKTTGEIPPTTVLDSNPHSCIPNLAETEVSKTKFVCRKRAREELSTPISTIYKEEFGKINNQGYDLVSEVVPYHHAKTSLCQIRRQALGTTQNPASSAEIEMNGDMLTLADDTNFLLLDRTSDDGQRYLVFSGSSGQTLLKSRTDFFLDGTFKSCTKQLYTLHADVGSTDENTNVFPVAYALLENKTKETYVRLFSALKVWGWSPMNIKVDYESAVIEAVKEVFPDSNVSGCSFHFCQALWRRIQDVGLVREYRENEEIRSICRMCSALALIPEDKVDDGWMCIMENVPPNQKLQNFLDYFVLQWMDNKSIPISLWKVHGERHRTNNPVEGWNSKFNKAVGNPHPNVYFVIQKLKEDAEEVDANMKAIELCLMPSEKRRRKYTAVDQRIRNVIDTYLESNLLKCLKVLGCITKLQ